MLCLSGFELYSCWVPLFLKTLCPANIPDSSGEPTRHALQPLAGAGSSKDNEIPCNIRD